MSEFKDELLAELLECGYADLTVLEDCKYNFVDVIVYCKEDFGATPTLNNLAYSMFQIGIGKINDAINERMDELREIEEPSEEESEELEALEVLEPYEDIESFHNYLDTSVYFTAKSEIYHKYMEEALDEFAENTGYSINN